MPIFKDPLTDKSKKSAKGYMRVERDLEGKIVVKDSVPESESGGLLEVIYEDGVLLKETSLQAIREKLKSQL